MTRLTLKVRVDCPRCRRTIIPIEGSKTKLERVRKARERVSMNCRDCGFRTKRLLTEEQIEQAAKDAVREAKIEADRARIKPSVPTNLPRLAGRFAPNPVARKADRVQVTGAAKLFHYAVYVRHPWGTDRIIVGVKRQRVQDARDAAWDKVGRVRKSQDLKIMDAVPMKWTPEGMVETRRTRIKTGEFKTNRRARSRASARTTKRKS